MSSNTKDNLKSSIANLKLNDLLNLDKVREKDLAILNSKLNVKKHKKVFSISAGINLNEVKKAKKYLEFQQMLEDEEREKYEHSKIIASKDNNTYQQHKYNDTHKNQKLKINFEELNRKHPQEKFLELYKNSIKINSYDIDNYNNCVNDITNKIQVKRGYNNQNMNQDDDTKNTNIKTQYLKKDDKKNLKKDLILTKESSNNNKFDLEKQKESALMIQRASMNTKFKKLSILKELIIDSLSYLYFNDISLKTYFTNNPITPKPLHRLEAPEFIEAAKFEKINEMNSYLNEDVNYLYEKDHFKQTALHWAAKRGYKDVVEKILSKGKSTNLFDNNNRTPMYLAVMNGHHHILEILLKNTNPKPINAHFRSRDKTALDYIKDNSQENFQKMKQMLGDYLEKTSNMTTKKFFNDKIRSFHYENYGSSVVVKHVERVEKDDDIIKNEDDRELKKITEGSVNDNKDD